MASCFYVIPVAADGSLPNDLAICDTILEANLAALQRADRHAGLVIAEELKPDEDLELVRVIGRVGHDVLAGLVV
jgi:hypothetical protein